MPSDILVFIKSSLSLSLSPNPTFLPSFPPSFSLCIIMHPWLSRIQCILINSWCLCFNSMPSQALDSVPDLWPTVIHMLAVSLSQSGFMILLCTHVVDLSITSFRLWRLGGQETFCEQCHLVNCPGEDPPLPMNYQWVSGELEVSTETVRNRKSNSKEK